MLNSKPGALVLFLALSPLIACRTNDNSSEAKHEIGTFNRNPIPITCSKVSLAPGHKELASYTLDHVDRILKANLSVIPPDLVRDSFCLHVYDYFAGSAGAESNGALHVGANMLGEVSNDAQFADVFSHELAHFLKQHNGKIREPQKLLEDPIYADLKSHRDQAKSKMDAALKEKSQFSGFEDHFRKFPPLRLFELALYSYVKALMEKSQGVLTKDEVTGAIDRYKFDVKDQSIIASYKPGDEGLTPEQLVAITAVKRKEYIALLDEAIKKEYLKKTPADYEYTVESIRHSYYQDKMLTYFYDFMGGPEIANNWVEQEADEVGLELYLRAGWDPQQAGAYWENRIRIKAKKNEKNGGPPAALGIADELSNCTRGLDSHPNFCWRRENYRNEMAKHKDAFALITAKDPAVNVFGDRLAELQKQFKLEAP